MRIRQVSVSRLFGLFDHKVRFRLDDRITIIHGPNGLGKTIILRMLAGLMEGKYGIFRRVPFERFAVEFDSGDTLYVQTDSADHPGQMTLIPGGRPSRRVVITAVRPGLPDEFFAPGADHERSHRRAMLLQRIDHLVPFLTRVGTRFWRHDQTGEMLGYDDVLERFSDALHLSPEEFAKEPERVRMLRTAVRVRLIRTQRLDTSEEVPTESARPSVTVEKHSEGLALHIRSVLEEYGAKSQKLDRNFPLRLFRQSSVAAMPVEDLQRKLAELEAKRARLTTLGFLDLEQDLAEIPDKIIEDKRDVFSIYVQDVDEKLAVFNEMAQRVELFTGIINARFLYKRLQISRDKGYLLTSDAGGSLQPSDLSSGEQHELVLVYELMFNVRKNSLVLIDEPEISLHVVWQQHFLPDLKQIVGLSGFDVLIATHSPEIIGDQWHLTEALKGPVGTDSKTDPADAREHSRD